MLIIDIDYHDSEPPAEYRIPYPPPTKVARSRGGGLHMMYENDDNAFKALIDVAHWSEGASGIDLLHMVNRNYVWQEVETTTSKPFATLLQPAADDIKERPAPWDQYEVGERLPKTMCPSGAHSNEDDPRPSVVVYEDGVFCHRCSRTWKWGELTPRKSDFLKMVHAHIHWDQVVFALMHHTHYLVPSWALKKSWKLFLEHVFQEGPEELINMMSSHRGIIRGPDGFWYSHEYNRYKSGTASQLIPALPFLYFWDEEGKKHIIPSRKAKALSADKIIDGDWPTYDYVTDPITPIVEPAKVIITKDLCRMAFSETNAVPGKVLTQLEAPDRFMEVMNTFKDFPWNIFKVLVGGALAAKFDDRLAVPPTFVITGPSGSGKGLLVNFVNAAFNAYGDNIHIPSGNTSEWERAMNVMLMDNQPAIGALDEFNKFPDRAYKYCLNLRREMSARPLYAENVQFKLRSAIAFLGTQVPPKWATDPQMQRRCFGIKLEQANIAWKNLPISPATIQQDIYLQRSAYGYIYQVYLEMIQYRSFYDWLKDQTGIYEMQNMYEDETKRRLLDLLESLANHTREEPRYPRANGWVAVHKTADFGSEAHEAWTAVADGPCTTPKWFSSDWLHACSIKDVLGLPYHVRFKISSRNRTTLLIKFEPKLEVILDDLG